MSTRNGFYYTAGLGFMALAKAKNVLHGYSTPKPFDMSDIDRCIEYDLNVVGEWLARLQQYTGGDYDLRNKDVLELGPGSDVGTGLCLLARGCSTYNACDVNNLVASTPDAFYTQLLTKLQSTTGNHLEALNAELAAARQGAPSRLNLVVRDDFDLVAAFGDASMDLVFSQAAFEHFDDVEATIEKLTAVCRPGATIVAEIDLQTHSRWIREKDPNSIYRYPRRLYDAFWFRGIPNRVRPFQYKDAFERMGWKNVTVTSLTRLNGSGSHYAGMHETFADEKNQMDYLSIVLCGRKSG